MFGAEWNCLFVSLIRLDNVILYNIINGVEYIHVDEMLHFLS